MGIPSYFSHILKKHSNILSNMKMLKQNARGGVARNGGTVFDSLYMDCNSIIYDALRQDGITGERQIVEYVIAKIKYYIQFIQPTKTVYIAFDGVAPFAKMEQQRTRRYKSAFMASVDFERGVKLNDEELEEKVKAELDSGKFHSCAITPGTSFMEYLAKQIEFSFPIKPMPEAGGGGGGGGGGGSGGDNPMYLKRVKIITSTSNEMGEGEHKMFEYMREHVEKDEVVAVYGLDADLIMLSIFHTFMCENIYIFREAPEFSQKILPNALRAGSENAEPIFIDTLHFIKSILKEMGCATFDAGRIYDYIFMCFMLGNDFLPHFPALNIRTKGINILMDTYSKMMGGYTGRYFISTKTGKIQWKWVSVFITELAKHEHEYILDEYYSREKMSARISLCDKTAKDREALFDNTPMLYRMDELYISPEDDGWKSRYYKTAFDGEEYTEQFVKKVCINYLEGLEWVFKYYTEGCPHWRWKYHYNYPPLLCDLVKYIPMFETDFLNSVCANIPNKAFHPYSQLVYVLPKIYHFLLPKHVQKKINYSSPYFPNISELKFKWMYCRYFWETHLELPEMSTEMLDYYGGMQ